jgi:hypothetical protein
MCRSPNVHKSTAIDGDGSGASDLLDRLGDERGQGITRGPTTNSVGWRQGERPVSKRVIYARDV